MHRIRNFWTNLKTNKPNFQISKSASKRKVTIKIVTFGHSCNSLKHFIWLHLTGCSGQTLLREICIIHPKDILSQKMKSLVGPQKPTQQRGSLMEQHDISCWQLCASQLQPHLTLRSFKAWLVFCIMPTLHPRSLVASNQFAAPPSGAIQLSKLSDFAQRFSDQWQY